MNDEAWFHVSGDVNAQYVRIWSDENPHSIQQLIVKMWGCYVPKVCGESLALYFSTKP
jgi:hypothetical protein